MALRNRSVASQIIYLLLVFGALLAVLSLLAHKGL